MQLSDVNRVITEFFGRKFKVSVKAMDTNESSENNISNDSEQTKALSPIDKLINKAKSENIDLEIK